MKSILLITAILACPYLVDDQSGDVLDSTTGRPVDTILAPTTLCASDGWGLLVGVDDSPVEWRPAIDGEIVVVDPPPNAWALAVEAEPLANGGGGECCWTVQIYPWVWVTICGPCPGKARKITVKTCPTPWPIPDGGGC